MIMIMIMMVVRVRVFGYLLALCHVECVDVSSGSIRMIGLDWTGLGWIQPLGTNYIVYLK